jgi:hypothetical protein
MKTLFARLIGHAVPALMLGWLLAAGAAFADWPSDGLPLATGAQDQHVPVGLTAQGCRTPFEPS